MVVGWEAIAERRGCGRRAEEETRCAAQKRTTAGRTSGRAARDCGEREREGTVRDARRARIRRLRCKTPEGGGCIGTKDGDGPKDDGGRAIEQSEEPTVAASTRTRTKMIKAENESGDEGEGGG